MRTNQGLCEIWTDDIHSTITVPLPTYRLASAALRSLSVDAELSPLVRRHFSLTREDGRSLSKISNNVSGEIHEDSITSTGAEGLDGTIALRTEYRATTNRMLRVAVNGFMESLGVVLGVMEELDVDVLAEEP